ncbi:MAG: polysaccharide pyruvyl transferase family protein [Pseudomonadota bacterium]|nr:polysaccharide pyruvyl transferase family protein [Pseudomonadota bacterium]
MKIALLTPYTGGNLGDAAIQEAVISNIRRRHPNADICLITLCPEVTAKLHGVPSFPITSFALKNYSPGPLVRTRHGNDANASPTVTQGLLSRVKATTKKSSLLYSVLKRGYQTLAAVGRGASLIREELLHFIRAYGLMKGVSLLLVSGGGQLDDFWGGPWGHPYALFKWGLIARAAGAKCVFLSVGTCSLESRLSAFFIRLALRFAAYRSYRDQTSKRLLKHLAFTGNDAVYPDLAFSYANVGSMHSPSSRKVERVVGVSPIAHLSQYYWPKKDLPVYECYFKNLIEFISDLIRQGYSIVLFSTGIPDRKVISDIVDKLAMDVTLDVTGRIHEPRTDTLNELFAQLLNVDYVVASRLHGVLLSHLLCIPVLAISCDCKVDTHMADMELSQYCLDIHNCEKASLAQALESLTANADFIKSRLKERCADYARALECQYDVVLGT